MEKRQWYLMPRMCSSLAVLCLLLSGSFGAASAVAEQSGPLARGFSYSNDQIRDRPWSVHIVKVDLANPQVELHTTLGRGNRFGLSLLSEQIKRLPPELGQPVAGINGDYYRNEDPYVGDPKGLQILRGELVSAPCTWTCFYLDASRKPHMTNVVSRFEVLWPTGERMPLGLNEERAADAAVLFTAAVGNSTHTSGGQELILERSGTNTWLPLQAGKTYIAQVREVREAGDTPLNRDVLVLSLGPQASKRAPKVTPGIVLQISTATSPGLDGVTTAIGGGPALVRNGKVIPRKDNAVRHPRAAIGWNKEFLFLVEVDGRQPYLSVGMTFAELADYLVKIGCEEAMSLDGGGSSTCWVGGQIMNSPSEGQERPMANALVLVRKDKQ